MLRVLITCYTPIQCQTCSLHHLLMSSSSVLYSWTGVLEFGCLFRALLIICVGELETPTIHIMIQQQQSRRRRRRHPDILDSSSEEEDQSLSGDDHQTVTISTENNIPLHQQKHDSTMNNDIIDESDTSVEEEDDELMNPYVMNPFNNSNNINNGIDVYSEQALLPPSVELASLSSNINTTNNTITNNNSGDVSNSDRRTNNGENIMGVQLGLTNIREPTQPPTPQQHINNLQPPRRGIINNRSFDPYAANTTTNINANANSINGGMSNYNNRELEMEEDTIEFHNPNSPIRKSNNNSNTNNIFGPLLINSSEQPINQTAHNRSIPQSRLNDATSTFPCATNSFSPFPTHYNNNTSSNKGRHYGEDTPLSSSNNSYAPSNYAPSYNSSHTSIGGVGGVVSTIKSILTSSINKLSSFYHGYSNNNLHNTFHHQQMSNGYNNRRPKFRINVRLFGIIMGMLFMFSSMVILYHAPSIKDSNNTSGMEGSVVNKSVYGVESSNAQVAGNVGSVVQGVSSTTGGETTGGTTNENKSIFTMENDEVKTIVMERMKKAKQHWWNKNHKKDSTATVQQGIDSSNQVQQGVNNGKEENVSSSSEQQQIINTNIGNNNGAVSSIEGLPAGVIVQTKEDGTVLIKLPPPPPEQQQQQVNANAGQQQQVNRLSLKEPSKLGLKEPISTKELGTKEVKELHPFGSTKEKELHPLGSAVKEENLPVPFESSSLGSSSINDGEETMYIKLPYKKEDPSRRTLTEKEQLELPQALKSSTKHHHTFHPPLPFESNHHKKQEEHPGMVQELKNEFTSWMNKHDKTYNTHEEKEHRFSIWRKNHIRIKEKNLKHGPCRLSGKSVFGHNLFSDLEPEEFQSKFLTGYKGPRHDHHKKGKSHFRDGAPEGHLTPLAAGVAPSVNRHPSVQRKLDEHIAKYGATSITAATSDGNNSNRLHGENKYQTKYYYGCPWWDVSCYLRKIFGYGMPGTREPIYDKDSYPTALDWRSMGAVSAVHSQGSCGACWAITAVETIESAYAIASGTLIDLSEEEVIACDGTCEMCNGGWPQNAVSFPHLCWLRRLLILLLIVPDYTLLTLPFYLFIYSTIMFKSIMVCQLKHNNMMMSGYIRLRLCCLAKAMMYLNMKWAVTLQKRVRLATVREEKEALALDLKRVVTIVDINTIAMYLLLDMPK